MKILIIFLIMITLSVENLAQVYTEVKNDSLETFLLKENIAIYDIALFIDIDELYCELCIDKISQLLNEEYQKKVTLIFISHEIDDENKAKRQLNYALRRFSIDDYKIMMKSEIKNIFGQNYYGKSFQLLRRNSRKSIFYMSPI